MIVSKLELGEGRVHLVETMEDSYRVIKNEFDRQSYIYEYGDAEIVEEKTHSTTRTTWRVPAFRVIRERYSIAKAKECERFGCE